MGIIVTVSFAILIYSIFVSACYSSEKEGFTDRVLPTASTLPQIPRRSAVPSVPATPLKKPTNTPQVADLPRAPVNNLAENNSLPYNDPALEKGTSKMLLQLKGDMDGFAASELPGLVSVGSNDPSITLPLTRFRGDYQRVKDEVLVIGANPGLQPQMTIEDIEIIAANLRFLQRSYRTYSDNQMLPAPTTDLSKVGTSREGFQSNGEREIPYEPMITPAQLQILSQKVALEIGRLLSSGTVDPVIQARAGIFTKIRQSLDDMIVRVNNGSLAPSDIPIKVKDYENFLPTLGSSSGPIGNLFTPVTVYSPSSANQEKPQIDVRAAPVIDAPRGEFEQTISTLDNKAPGFNWKRRAEEITENIRRAEMNPDDFGCMKRGVQVSKDFSWRGHTKMVCSRLSTALDPGIPEQMGCPPVSWKGWRL